MPELAILQYQIFPSYFLMNQVFTPPLHQTLSSWFQWLPIIYTMICSQSSYMTPHAAVDTLDYWPSLASRTPHSEFSFYHISNSPSLLCFFLLISPTSEHWNGPMAHLQDITFSYRHTLISSGPMSLKYQLYAYLTNSSPPLNFTLMSNCPFNTPA